MVIRFEVDPGNKFKDAVKQATKEVSDLTIPLTLISQSWFKSNQAIFALQGRGKYEDLSEKYKDAKKSKFGFIYPILRARGNLEKSITDPGAVNSINKIINKQVLTLGSSVPYGPYHQFGTMKMPARPFVLIGAEQVAPSGLNNRLEAWVAILANYTAQRAAQLGTLK